MVEHLRNGTMTIKNVYNNINKNTKKTTANILTNVINNTDKTTTNILRNIDKKYIKYNNEHIKQYNKQYRETRKQYISEKAKVKMICECGRELRTPDLNRHSTTNIHKQLMEKRTQ